MQALESEYLRSCFYNIAGAKAPLAPMLTTLPVPKDTSLTLQEVAEQPEKNAFEALKKPRNRKNEKQKPLKTVTNTRSTPAVTKTKQPKIYDESNGRKSLAGTKKIEMR